MANTLTATAFSRPHTFICGTETIGVAPESSAIGDHRGWHENPSLAGNEELGTGEEFRSRGAADEDEDESLDGRGLFLFVSNAENLIVFGSREPFLCHFPLLREPDASNWRFFVPCNQL